MTNPNISNPQLDIRIGTLVSASKGAPYIRQILPHGFESFSLTFWQKIDVDFAENAAQVLEACGDSAIISSLGFFGNPLQNEDHVRGIEGCIDNAHLYGTNIVAGFAGALEDRPLPESLPQFKKVWGELAKRAEDKGVKIAWENCEMGGSWNRPQYNIAHAPTAWEMLFNEVPSPALGLQWEPCHQMVSLIDPLPQLRKWIEKIFHVHGKDATIAWDVLRQSGLRGGQPFVWHRTPGFGDTNWSDVISILRQNGWSGAIDIEGWHDPVYKGELEMTGQVHGLNYLKRCRGGAFVPNPV
jgi:sugar phosphate isomerase/epimerase